MGRPAIVALRGRESDRSAYAATRRLGPGTTRTRHPGLIAKRTAEQWRVDGREL